MKNDLSYYVALILRTLISYYSQIRGLIYYLLIKYCSMGSGITNLNLGGGTSKIKGYFNIDLYSGADLCLDLGRMSLPFAQSSMDAVICISAINYFTKERGAIIVSEVYRVLKPGGIVRFGTQDFKSIAERYVRNDEAFFFQKLPNGQERFVGETMCDKINSWFYGYAVARGHGCKYFYDYETLAKMFSKAGFSKVEQRKFQDSRLSNIAEIDNRADEMFFLEAVK